MKIDSIRTTNTKATDKKKKAASTDSASAAFASLLSGASETTAPPSVTETIAPSDINPMLGLQEVPDDEISKKKALKHGKTTLDLLEDLRHQLLIGSIPLGTLQGLDRLVQQQRQYCNDPRLEAVLNEIEVRAAVELAKLEVAQNAPKY